MARTLSEKVGRGPCPSGCGATVTYRKSSGGMLTHKCDGCDSSGYAEPGGDAYKTRIKTIQPTAPAAEPKGEEKPTPKAPTTTPPTKAKNSVFALGDL